ncbi:MAG: replicative DNA helicase [Planctomycetota bacterium]|nr:MAG: replicative DNA helicase [Planctomycetota bacterium]GDY09722.1 replicative DNA helicase [Planctomycetia bacterium]
MPASNDTRGFQGKLPPQNLEAEMSVLGSILLMHEAIDEVGDVLKADHFYADRHQKIFAAVMGLYENGVRGIDAVTLAEELDRRKELDEIGGVEYLGKILEAVPNAAHAKYYAKIIRDRWIQRSLAYACTEILEDCYTGANDTEDVLSSAEQRIFGILEQQETVEKLQLHDILIDAFDRIRTRMELGGSISGLSSGFADLDSLLNGFQGSELIILAARPAMGKTALICNIAESVVADSKQPCLVFSLEMSKLELAERLLCIRAKVNGHRLRAGTIDEVEHEALMKAASELSEMPMFIDDQPGRSMPQIGAVARRLKRRFGLSIIIIDYLQLIEPEEKAAPREQQVSLITRRLKYLSKELNVPVIALAQLNRGVELREDKRPRLADLRESGSIEQDADVVMFLHRPALYDPEDRPGEAELIVAKNRHGPTGIVSLSWLSESMRFGNLTRIQEPAGGFFGGKSGGGGFDR